MTLYISVTQIDRLPRGGNLFVEGSRAGLLASPSISSSQRFNPPFLVKCAADDVLTFKVAKNLQSFENNDYFAQGTLYGPVLTKRYRNELLGLPSQNIDNNTQPQQQQSSGNFITNSILRRSQSQPRNTNVPNGVLAYEIELYGQDGQSSAGIIYCTITYDRASHFEGEFVTGSQRQAIKSGQKVAMFKGKCPTKNLFSMIDPACEGQQRKFIESIYKDGEQEYVV